MNTSNRTWPRLKKLTEWGYAYTVQHAVYTNKARWVVRTKDGLRYEHILVWEKHHGMKLPKGWVVHHKDGEPLNNSIENLQAMTHAEHNSLHKRGVMRSHVLTPSGVEGRQCNECLVIKPLSEFPKNGTSLAGTPVYRPTCRTCGTSRQRLNHPKR